jgi:diguanylate cyclase (GGDEF)-like protein
MMDRPGRLGPALLQGTVVLGMAMIALLWVSILAFERIDRQARVEAATMNTSNLARAFGEHTARTIFGEDSTLVVLRAMLQRDAGSFKSVDWKNLPDSVLQYSVIDRNGKLAASSLGPAAATDLSDRQHFLHHLNSDADSLYVGRPVSGHASQRASIQLSRKLTAPGGEFSGVVVASLDQKKLTDFYETIDMGKDGAISLVGLDGHVRASRGFKTDIKSFSADSPLQRRAQTSPEGTYITPGSFDGVSRLLSYRKVENLPLIVTAAVSKAEILASHYREVSKVKVIGAGITAMIIAVMGFSVSNRMRLDRANSSLRDSEAAARQSSDQLRTTLENIDQGIIMVDPEGFIQVINHRAAQLLDIPDAWLERRLKFSELRALLWDRGEFEGAQQPHIHKMFADPGIYSGPIMFERSRPNGTVLEVRNVHLLNGGLVRTISDITARRRAEERIRHLALHDELTELANRAAFRERIEYCYQRAHRHGECFALLTFDLDRFKNINDGMGHLAGDGVLRETARRLKACVRDGDLAVRLGGDEFAIVQSNIHSIEDAAELAQRILEAMRAPFRIGDRRAIIGISIGIALAPRHASHFKELTAAADAALYRAKHSGGDRYSFHEGQTLRTVA